MDYKSKLNLVIEFIRAQGDDAFNNWHKFIITNEHDNGSDVTTNFDKKIEKEFSDFILKNFPECGFRGEEHKYLDRDGEYVWHIDPIDGTKYFAAGIPFWSVTVALVQNGEPLFGLIYNPSSKQMYSAIQGQGAYLNGKKIEIKRETDISKLQVSIDMSETHYSWHDYGDESKEIIGLLSSAFYRTRMLGNGAFSLAWLAQGFFGAFVDIVRAEKKLVDVIGGYLIAKEAGAEIYQIDLGCGLYRAIIGRPEVVSQIKDILDIRS